MNITPIDHKIEFMAWDKKRNKMLTGDGQGEVLIIAWSGDLAPMYHSSDISGDTYCSADLQDESFQDDIELMQLTALRSINDEPIYNHMIVKNEFSNHFLVDMFNYPIMEFLTRFDLEIVGNIFQHSELLELCK